MNKNLHLNPVELRQFGLALLISLSVTLPFFSWFRYAPLTDWVSDASALFLLACSLPLMLPMKGRSVVSSSWVFLFAFAVGFYLLLSNKHLDSATVFIVLVLFLGVWSLLFSSYFNDKKTELLIVVSSVIFLACLLQALLGLSQIFRLAPFFSGYIIFDQNGIDSNIMGNIGQRNQYAQFLCWGIVSASYLYAMGRLRGYLFFIAVLFLSWLAACSGARLVWAYAIIFALVAFYWYVRRESDDIAKMSGAMAVAVGIMILTQLMSHQITELLALAGLPVHTVSGTERFFSAGFGARRWVEWTKAIDIFLQHPFFGIGWGRFGAQSVEMELSAGLPKVPESWLFTHCHNLVLQLLAETGLVGCLLFLVPVIIVFCGYLQRGQQTKDNMLLVSIGLLVLAHSMFEYPVWYLPFLVMFLIVLLMAPLKPVQLKVRTDFLRIVGLVASVLALLYTINGVENFRVLVAFRTPAVGAADNLQRLNRLFEIEKNPLWAADADFVLTSYLVPSRSDIDLKLKHFERLASFRPYPDVLLKLSILYALNKNEVAAEHTLKMAIANYPDFAANYSVYLTAMKELDLKSLQRIALTAAHAYAAKGSQYEDARIAAVMTVASPVTRKPLF
ncbi:PglL family O-oligosaccharyltransferase [Aquitalea sp. ASV15]|uniref:PglL family O-oligosaccharyltransferase n=1 Tax=Aquitalea sp. ASV15 TaxID=2795104 RepID=UPI0018EA98BD|nr:O-antigen ligase family protein [Aquitalea sp. ASV15]